MLEFKSDREHQVAPAGLLFLSEKWQFAWTNIGTSPVLSACLRQCGTKWGWNLWHWSQELSHLCRLRSAVTVWGWDALKCPQWAHTTLQYHCHTRSAFTVQALSSNGSALSDPIAVCLGQRVPLNRLGSTSSPGWACTGRGIQSIDYSGQSQEWGQHSRGGF